MPSQGPSNQGFSLIGVLVAMFASVAILLAITNMFLAQQKATKGLMLDMIAAQFTMDIQRRLKSGTVCTDAFKNVNIGTAAKVTLSLPPHPPLPASGPPPRLRPGTVSPLTNAIREIDKFSPSLSIKTLYLEKVDPTDNVTPIDYRFIMQIEKDREVVVGATVLKRLTNIVTLDVVGGTVQDPACLMVDGLPPGPGVCQTVASPVGVNTVSCPPGWTMTGASCDGTDACSGSDTSMFGGKLTPDGIVCQTWMCTTVQAFVRCCNF